MCNKENVIQEKAWYEPISTLYNVCSLLGGVQYRGLYHEYCGGYLEYRGGCSVPGGISGYMWGYHEYRGV